MFSSAYPIQGHGEPGVYLRGLRAEGGGYLGRGLPVGHTHKRTHTRLHTTKNLEMPVSLQHMPLDWKWNSESPEETPKAWGKLHPHRAES